MSAQLLVAVRSHAEDATVRLGRVRVSICAPAGMPPREATMRALEALGIRVAKEHPSVLRVQRIVKKHGPKVKEFVLQAVKNGRAEFRRHGLDAAFREIEVSFHALPTLLHAAVIDAGAAAFDAGKRNGFKAAASLRSADAIGGLSFDEKDPNAILWAQEHGAELVTGISDETRAAIRSVIVRAQEEGLSIDDQKLLIEDVIGLTESSANAVLSQYEKDIAEGVDPDEAMSDAADYSDELLDSRAETISRTETSMAANEGQHESWSQAQDNGLLPPDVMRQWIANQDCCPLCDEMDEQVVALEDPFDGPDGEVDNPPLHPNCRCSQGIASADDTEQALSDQADAELEEQTGEPTDAARRQLNECHDEHGQFCGGDGSSGSGADASSSSALTPDESSALHDYQVAAWEVNGGLRQQEGYDRPDMDTVHSLDSAIAKSPGLDSAETLYRGIPFDVAGEITGAGVGSVFQDKAFVSTSRDIGAAKKFSSQYIVHIDAPAGTKGLDMNKIRGDHSLSPHEKEFVLPRGTSFRVTNIVQTAASEHGPASTHIHVEMVHHG